MNGLIDLPDVSRETFERLQIYVDELRRWQRAVNLVSPSTLGTAWHRHVQDCLQLRDVVPDAETWLDMGSGGGLPGLVLAADDRLSVTLVESDSRKCAFLRHTASRMGIRVDIREGRLEELMGDIRSIPHVVTARALAPLTRLLGYAHPLIGAGAIGVFPKGKRVKDELTDAHESWTFDLDVRDSRTDPDGRILCIRHLAPSRHDRSATAS